MHFYLTPGTSGLPAKDSCSDDRMIANNLANVFSRRAQTPMLLSLPAPARLDAPAGREYSTIVFAWIDLISGAPSPRLLTAVPLRSPLPRPCLPPRKNRALEPYLAPRPRGPHFRGLAMPRGLALEYAPPQTSA